MSAISASVAVGDIGRRSESGPAPLSFGQELLWLIDRASPGTTVWNVARPFRLHGSLDVGALQQAIKSLSERHEALRTVYADTPGGPRAIVLPVDPNPILRVDFTSVAPEFRGEAAERFVREQQSLPFELARDAPLRIVLASFATDDHVLCLVTHHIISDGWSKNVMFRDLSALYAAFARDEPAALAPLPIQFSDYAAWERGESHQAELTEKIAFWRRQLEGAPHAVELPTDRPRPIAPAYDAGRSVLVLPPALVEGVIGCARKHETTLYVALLATYVALLGRYSGQDDILVGSPIVGRAHTETEEAIGFFANTLVLRTRLDDDPTFSQLLTRVRNTFFDAYEHQDVPVEQLVLELRKDRELTLAPLFNVILTMEDVLGDELILPGVAAEEIECEQRATKFDFTLLAARRPEGLRLTLWYRTDLFGQPTADRFLAHFGRLLEAVIADPSVPVSGISLISHHERRTLVAAPEPLPGEPVSVAELFARVVRAQPGATALVCGPERRTYAELDAGARRVARQLKARGVVRGTRVGLGLDRSVGAIVALLGIWQSGAAYVPLPPDLPAARIASIIDQCGLRVIVTDAAGRANPVWEATSVACVIVDAPEDSAVADAGENEHAVAPVLDLDDLAYIIFTSGSTGVPKGVAVTHRNLAGYVAAISQRLGLEPSERWAFASVSSLGADLGNTAVFPALASGGTLHVVPPDVATDAQRYARWAAAESIDVLKITPSHLAALMAHENDAPLPLRWLILGGEACPRDLVRRVRSGSACAILNHYGPTETTVGACTHIVDERAGFGEAARVPIGKPLAGVACYVLDRHCALVPDGVPGELFVGGAGVAQGYFGQPELTAARFLPDPFAAQPGLRMYRTGDRVRRLPGGELEFLGRQDDQVKVRGYRVELGEIASVLGTHPDVAESAAVLRTAGSGEPQLVAYVTMRGGTDPKASGQLLREWLVPRLPDYMIPTSVAVMASLPLKPNGKLDRDALPDPDSLAGKERFVAPRTPTEERVAAVWREILGSERVSVTADFLSLGFHSILAIRALDTLGRIFAIRVPIRSFFESKTIERLAGAIDAEVARAAERELERQLAFVESLSDADVAAMLAEPAGGDGA